MISKAFSSDINCLLSLFQFAIVLAEIGIEKEKKGKLQETFIAH